MTARFATGTTPCHPYGECDQGTIGNPRRGVIVATGIRKINSVRSERFFAFDVAGMGGYGDWMNEGQLRLDELPGHDAAIGFLHQIGRRMAAADPLNDVLVKIVDFVAAVVKCDSCFVYVLENKHLILRASKNPHPEIVGRLKMPVGQGITGWVAEHREPVAVGSEAFNDSRFQSFNELPEDRYEAFLSVPILCRNKVVGVINLQHRRPHTHSEAEIQLISTIGFLVGAEVEMARLEEENSHLSEELESRKIIERGKGILQRDLRISEEEAYLMLQKQSRQRRLSMRQVAEAVILSEEIKRAQAKGASA